MGFSAVDYHGTPSVSPSPRPLYAVEQSGRSLWFQSFAGNVTKAIQEIASTLESLCPTLLLLDRSLAERPSGLLSALARSHFVIIFATSLPRWSTRGLPFGSHQSIVFCPIEFELPKFRQYSPCISYVEPSIIKAYNQSESLPSEIEAPFILCTFGTQSGMHFQLAERLLCLLEAAERRTDLHFVITAGYTPQAQHLIASSKFHKNVTLLPSVSIPALMPKATAFISHGGLGGIKEAIYHGIPQIVLPVLYDQPFNAKRVAGLGIGECIFPEQLTPMSLTTALSTVLGADEYKENLKQLTSVFRAIEQQSPGVTLIDQHLRWQPCADQQKF